VGYRFDPESVAGEASAPVEAPVVEFAPEPERAAAP
jgi:hypothetical protein